MNIWGCGVILAVFGIIADIIVVVDRQTMGNFLCLIIDMAALVWAFCSHYREEALKAAARARERAQADRAETSRLASEAAAATASRGQAELMRARAAQASELGARIAAELREWRATAQLEQCKKDAAEAAAKETVKARAREDAARAEERRLVDE